MIDHSRIFSNTLQQGNRDIGVSTVDYPGRDFSYKIVFKIQRRLKDADCGRNVRLGCRQDLMQYRDFRPDKILRSLGHPDRCLNVDFSGLDGTGNHRVQDLNGFLDDFGSAFGSNLLFLDGLNQNLIFIHKKACFVNHRLFHGVHIRPGLGQRKGHQHNGRSLFLKNFGPRVSGKRLQRSLEIKHRVYRRGL